MSSKESTLQFMAESKESTPESMAKTEESPPKSIAKTEESPPVSVTEESPPESVAKTEESPPKSIVKTEESPPESVAKTKEEPPPESIAKTEESPPESMAKTEESHILSSEQQPTPVTTTKVEDSSAPSSEQSSVPTSTAKPEDLSAMSSNDKHEELANKPEDSSLAPLSEKSSSEQSTAPPSIAPKSEDPLPPSSKDKPEELAVAPSSEELSSEQSTTPSSIAAKPEDPSAPSSEDKHEEIAISQSRNKPEDSPKQLPLEKSTTPPSTAAKPEDPPTLSSKDKAEDSSTPSLEKSEEPPSTAKPEDSAGNPLELEQSPESPSTAEPKDTSSFPLTDKPEESPAPPSTSNQEQSKGTKPTDKPQQSTTTSLPLKTRLYLSMLSTVVSTAMRPDGTLNRRLFNFLDRKASTNSKPVKGVKTHDVTIDQARNLWFRVFVPVKNSDTQEKIPVFIYYHGGGFSLFNPNTKSYDDLCHRFARQIPAVVVSSNYRLAPEHRYPTQYDDGFDVLKFLENDDNRKHLSENADLSRCFLSGDSAGGNLAYHVCKRVRENKFQQLKVIGLVMLQPFFGGEERTASEISPQISKGQWLTLKETDWFWSVFKPTSSEEEWNRDHEVINVTGPKAVDISGLDLPPTLVVVGGRDILQDRQRRYYDWLKNSGKEAYLVEYPTMFHGFIVFPELPEASQVVSEVTDFVNKLINKSSG